MRSSGWQNLILGAAVFASVTVVSTSRAELHYGVIWYAPAPSEEIRRLVAQRYDLGVTGLSSGADRLAIKNLNPTFRWFVYMSGTDNYVPPHPHGTPEHDSFVALAKSRGMDPEAGYIHYWEDTSVEIQGKTVTIPGWGGGSAADPAMARVPVYSSDLSRRARSFATVASRQLYKEIAIATRLDAPFPDTELYADGILLDNASGHLFNRGKITAGGRVREAPGRASIDSNAFKSWYLDCFVSFTAALRDTLQTSPAWSRDSSHKELMINIANVWEDAFIERDAADILLLEFQYNPVRSCGPDAIETAFKRDARAAQAGITSFYSAGMTRSVHGRRGELPLANVMLGNLAWYLLTRSPTTYFYQQGTNSPATAGWDTLTWRGAMDVAATQLGEAVGAPYTLAKGMDPLGNRYTVHARRYERGLVLLRNRGTWREGVEAATAVWVDLPGYFAPVRPSGAITPVVNRVALRNGEGALLLGGLGTSPKQ